ncbi:Gfo/Idh/MocA family oxidoreductase [Sinomonas sp. ASV322]|uniref:Gfo/Idh/MocA family oxidoreductase n=1 Tax=Sinomonas sp. ASV322 TaxID=3041920 RepID=UPI0027DE0E28|nr:Gfo/Idh/MocA family oxidoreductase [Sinomonas sp. ASV322]MDQ4503114.1 Gfo/Idh/MocA family oxidoreductase [Sinomonas sp. ASV322]
MTYLPVDSARPAPARIALIGAGWMGAYHARSLALRIPGAELVAIADPAVEAARSLAAELGVPRVTPDPADLFADPEIDAVVIAGPARFHAQLSIDAARAGKHVFCEKPGAVNLEELARVEEAVAEARVKWQIGFNRRYAADFLAARREVAAGAVGTPQLLRSVTRDPGSGSIPHAGRIPQWTIFLETLIHDFDALNWLNPGAEPVSVHVTADALVEPSFKDAGLLDTAVVTVRYANGAIAVAEANFSALYGYDVRGEVFGSAGMVQAGRATETAAVRYGASGLAAETPRLNIELFADAYTAELADFAQHVRARRDGAAEPDHGVPLTPGLADARRALAVALACIESAQSGATAAVAGASAAGAEARS